MSVDGPSIVGHNQTSPSPSPPLTRGSSPSPSVSPSMAHPHHLSCPPLDRSFSTASSISTFSTRSSTSRSSTGSAITNRRGYVRPQGVAFAESAKNRDSVMSLGSIAHLQYYFARTGMLDGKGGQFAKDRKKDGSDFRVSIANYTERPELPGGELVQSPIDEVEIAQDWDEPMMLPPTVSTYSHKTQYIPPPPDAETLREELRDSLVHVTKAMSDARLNIVEELDRRKEDESTVTNTLQVGDSLNQPSQSHGWHQIQGMHILDIVTLAIRAAKIYYTTHEHPQRLYKIKSERQIREELLGVLDILKRNATRNFAGGMREEELRVIENWVFSVQDLMAKERIAEEQEAKDRESWAWLEGGWLEKDRRREWLFMNTFLEGFNEKLPEWQPPSEAETLPTPFLEALSNGLTLVHLHNRILRKSKRRLGEIKNYHIDTMKPYRAAENLRFWIKEAEIRWETKLQVNVMDIVYNRGPEAWAAFDAAILQWCSVVREEITREWKKGSVQVSSPVLGAEKERDID